MAGRHQRPAQVAGPASYQQSHHEGDMVATARGGAMKPRISMRAALEDKQLLGRSLPGDTWRNWRILLVAMMGESLTDDERVIFKELTGRDHEPGVRVEEFVGVIGRRGGKSRAIAALVAYVVALCDHPELVPGERGMALIIASDQEQSLTVLSYVEAAFRQSPILRQLIEAKLQRTIRLTNGLSIMVRASDYRRVRGVTILLAVADELAFFVAGADSPNPDTEIIGALRPALSTCGGLLAIISSPHARRGELYALYKKHYGPTGDPLILVAQAPSRTMNPSLSENVVRRAVERDAIAAAAEYGAEFRSDVANFIDREIIMANVMPNVREIPPALGTTTYKSFVDPSGGSSDSYACAVAHSRGDVIVIDALREIPAPFSPEIATAELAVLLKSYNVGKVVGDKYAGSWPSEAFMRHGIHYEPAAQPKSNLYLAALPLLNSARIEMPDNGRLISQLANLERRTARGGRESVDHPPNSHDDLANVCLGVATLFVSGGRGYSFDTWRKVAGMEDDPMYDSVEALLERSRAMHAKTGSFAVKIGNDGIWLPSIDQQTMLLLEAAERARRNVHPTHAQITAEFARLAKTEGEK